VGKERGGGMFNKRGGKASKVLGGEGSLENGPPIVPERVTKRGNAKEGTLGGEATIRGCLEV